MDDAVKRLERARAAAPDDVGVAVELARAYVRVGRPLRALAVLGPADPAEREVAGRALAAALGLEWGGVVRGSARFVLPAARSVDLLLVPAGAFHGDGERALTEARPAVPAFLAALMTEPALDADGAERQAAELGGRLLTGREWMKLWRGGLFLDGDDSRRVANPQPHRLLPTGLGDVPSPYGAHFATDACELLDGYLGGVFDVAIERYFVRPDRRGVRALVWRLARGVPEGL